MVRYATAMAALFLATPVIAGPFGLDMGTSIEELNKTLDLTQKEPNFFQATTLPNGHPDMIRYNLIATPTEGLCKVAALTNFISTSEFGTELHARFDRFKESLTDKYGKPENEWDFVRSGSLWQESRYWMMGILKKDRILATSWTAKKSPLPDNLDNIMLQAKATDTDKGVILITYEFTNAKPCLAHMRKSEDQSL